MWAVSRCSTVHANHQISPGGARPQDLSGDHSFPYHVYCVVCAPEAVYGDLTTSSPCAAASIGCGGNPSIILCLLFLPFVVHSNDLMAMDTPPREAAGQPLDLLSSSPANLVSFKTPQVGSPCHTWIQIQTPSRPSFLSFCSLLPSPPSLSRSLSFSPTLPPHPQTSIAHTPGSHRDTSHPSIQATPSFSPSKAPPTSTAAVPESHALVEVLKYGEEDMAAIIQQMREEERVKVRDRPAERGEKWVDGEGSNVLYHQVFRYLFSSVTCRQRSLCHTVCSSLASALPTGVSLPLCLPFLLCSMKLRFSCCARSWPERSKLSRSVWRGSRKSAMRSGMR